MWPQHIINNFRSIPEDSPLGNDYYGVYNKVLFLEFFERPKFAINPVYALPDFEKPGVDPEYAVVSFAVTILPRVPVLFLEIKPLLDYDLQSARASADTQMRDKLRTLSAITSIPRLYGLSVMGTRFAVYTLDRDTGHIEPECIAPGASDVNDTAPQAWWKFDVTTEAGCKRFEEVVGDVKVMSAALS